jgi:hypothetical protein
MITKTGITRESSKQRSRPALDRTLGTRTEHRTNHDVTNVSWIDSSVVQNSLHGEETKVTQQ